MKLIIILILLLVPLTARAGEDKPDDCEKDDVRPQCLFDLDNDGEVTTEDGEAEATFTFPPVKAGFLLDFKNPDFLPHISIEALSWEVLGESFAVDIGGTSGRAFVSLDWELIPIMKLGPMVWGGWNVPEKTYSFGVGFSIIKF